MSAEYRTLEPLPFCLLDKRLEKYGIMVEMGAKVTKLIAPYGQIEIQSDDIALPGRSHKI
jgi:hypothetical protein